jgi:hypothetical protein
MEEPEARGRQMKCLHKPAYPWGIGRFGGDRLAGSTGPRERWRGLVLVGWVGGGWIKEFLGF